MRHMNKIATTLGVGLTLLMMTSCYQKELCYTHPHTEDVNVVFDWKNDPTAKPATMRLYTFSRDDDRKMRYEFTDYHGGKISMEQGNHDALCINSDAHRNFFRNIESRNTFEIYTEEATTLKGISELAINLPRARGGEKERMVFQPDSVWCDVTTTPFMLPLNEGIQNSSYTLTLYPKPLFCTYTVDIHNAQNLKHIKGMSATLSGLAGSVMAETGIPTEELVTIPFDVYKLPNNTSITGSFRTFGYSSKQAKPEHKLVVYVVLSDGSRKFYTYDVTDQVRKAPDPYHVHIVLDGLPLPKPISNGNGIKPTVKEWDRIEIPIKAYN